MSDNRDDLVGRVKEANDIVEVVGSYLALRPVGKTFKGLCPFHDDSRPSFDVDPRRQRYRCWSCNKFGDVINFIQEYEHVAFPEALEVLARRAGIPLEKTGGFRQNSERAVMIESVRWAADQFHKCLLDAACSENARRYLGERKLTGETVRRFGIGFAPPMGDWLVKLAQEQRMSLEILEKVGLVGKREDGGCYDRFKDRVIFPIRDARGQPLGFGGRILPGSPLETRGAPKYYNSAETPLFSKSELLYGLDQARQAAAAAGYLAVVEGYTDVLMAHQMGIGQVVATMGTALNSRHVKHLRLVAPKVVLVFDADEGGATGVDRALRIFVSGQLDLRIATLPEGKDPCDLLVEQGPEPFGRALENAVDALEFKLNATLGMQENLGIPERLRALEEVLQVIALEPEVAGAEDAIKRQMIVTRIGQRLKLKEEQVWARLKELRQASRKDPRGEGPPSAKPVERQSPAPAHERELLQVLLADPELVQQARNAVEPEELTHPGLRGLLEGMFGLYDAAEVPDLDHLRPRIENPRLAEYALRMQEIGRANLDRATWLGRIVNEFRKRRAQPIVQELHNQLQAVTDHTEAVDLLRQLQNKTASE